MCTYFISYRDLISHITLPLSSRPSFVLGLCWLIIIVGFVQVRNLSTYFAIAIFGECCEKISLINYDVYNVEVKLRRCFGL